jgi:hypothetical protein
MLKTWTGMKLGVVSKINWWLRYGKRQQRLWQQDLPAVAGVCSTHLSHSNYLSAKDPILFQDWLL